MTKDQIEEILKFSGDSIEEKWKPGRTDNYLDIYYYWKLRELNKAGTIEGLFPETGLMAETTLYKLERLPQYYHSVYARLAKVATEKQLINSIYDDLVQNKLTDNNNIFDNVETFYYFIGSILDNLGGLANIVTGNKRGAEDSFNDFLKYKQEELFRTDSEKNLIRQITEIKDHYRDHLTHRPRFSTITFVTNSKREIHIQSEFNKINEAKWFVTWRKETRDIVEGRKKSQPIIDVINCHFDIIVQTCDLIFKKCFENYQTFLLNEKLSDKKTYTLDPMKPPADTKYILFACDKETSSYLKYWLHNVSKPFPTNCTLESCKSNNIRPVYFLK